MTPQPDKTKRWRPRFSVRTLVILVTLVCAYAACWGPTKTRGVYDVLEHVTVGTRESVELKGPGWLFAARSQPPDEFVWYTMPEARLPCVVEAHRMAARKKADSRRFYFWFFGYVAKLPWEREVQAQIRMPPPPTN